MKKFKLRNSHNLTYRGFFKRRMLTLGEANERLHMYFPKMKIIEYHRANCSALVYCIDCGETFVTKNKIGDYLYGNRVECERCKYKRLLNKYNEILKVPSLTVVDWFNTNNRTKAKIECIECGSIYEYYVCSLQHVRHCKACSSSTVTNKCIELLNNKNCEYISRRCVNRNTLIKYKCKICGKVAEVFYDTAYNRAIICDDCNHNFIKNRNIRRLNSTVDYTKERGAILINYVNRNNIEFKHLFCGNNFVTNKYSLSGRTLCSKCSSTVSIGKRKDHNKHLVQEYSVILKNIQKLKNILDEHNQLENFPEGEIKVILEHIDGWVKNYEEIMNEYPNGDLGSILEKNPLYERCEELFYPTMDKFGIEKIK